jgi:hypothetical protein
MPTNAELKTLVNDNIRTKTLPASITKGNTANAIDAGYDYTDQQTPIGFFASVLSQSGTGIPSGTSKNNTGFTFTWSRTTTGTYVLTCSADLSAYICILSYSNPLYGGVNYTLRKSGASTFQLRTYDFTSGTPTLSDDSITGGCLKIEIHTA